MLSFVRISPRTEGKDTKNPDTHQEYREIFRFKYYFISKPIGICDFKGYTLLYSLTQFVRMHTHIPKGCDAQNITFYVIDHFVIVVDNKGAIWYFPVT